MATIASLIVQIAADTSALVRNVEESTRTLNDFNEHAVSTIAKGAALGEIFVQMGEKILEVGVEAVKKLGEALVDLALQGSHVADVEAGFDHLTESAGLLGSQLLGTVRNGTHGTIDDFVLMKQVNQDLAAGLNLTTDQYGLMSQGAFALAKVTGGDVATALESMNTAMVTGRAKALALLTGKVDLKKAEEDFAIAAGHSKDELTAEGKLEADREAMLNAIQAALGRVGDQQDSLADKVAQARTWWANLNDQLGKSIATSPIVIQAFDGVKQILIDTFGGDQQQQVKALTKIIETLVIDVVDFGSAAVQAGAFAFEAWNALEIVFDRAYNGLLHIESGLLKTQLVAVQAKSWVEPWNDWSQAIADLQAHIRDVQATITDNQHAVAAHEAAEQKWAVAGQVLSDKLQDLKNHLIATRDATTDFVGPIETATDAQNAAGEAAKKTGDYFKESAADAKKYAEAWVQLNSIGETYLDTVNAINPQLLKEIEYYIRAGAAVATLAAAYKDQLTEAQIKAVETFVKTTDAGYIELEKVTNDYFKAVNAASHNTLQVQVNDAYLAADSRIAAMEKTKSYSVAAEMVIWQTADQTANNIIQKYLEADVHSREHYLKLADDAKIYYDFVQAHSESFTQDWIVKARQQADAAQLAADRWGTSFVDNANKAIGAISAVSEAMKSFSLVGSATPVGIQGKLSDAAMMLAGYEDANHRITALGEAAGYGTSKHANNVSYTSFDVGGPILQDGPIMAHAGEFVVPKGGTLVGGSGGGSVTIAPGAVVLNYPIMNDAQAKEQIAELLGDALYRRIYGGGVRVSSGA